MYIGPNSLKRIPPTVAKKKPPKSPTAPWDYVVQGYQALKRQTPTAASVSTNLRIGSIQLKNLLGTGLTTAMSTAGMYAGLAAALMRAAGAAEKLVTAVQKRDISPALDGVRDLGSAAVLGLASSGKWALRRTVLPIYAGFSTFRGGFNYVKGHVTKNKPLKVSGRLEALRSAGLTARSLQRHSKWLAFAGKALAPVVGVLETAQGLKSLSTGLEKNNNKLELKGVVDITSALGTTLLLTGVATTPGLVLFGAAQLAYTLYNMNSKIQKVMDRGIDSVEPTALKARDGIRDLKVHLKDRWERWRDPFGNASVATPKKAWVDPTDPVALKLEDDAWELFLTTRQENDDLR